MRRALHSTAFLPIVGALGAALIGIASPALAQTYPPSAYRDLSAPSGLSSCVGCHGTPTLLPASSGILANNAGSGSPLNSTSNLVNFLKTTGLSATMNSLGNALDTQSADLSAIWQYLVSVREGIVSNALGTTLVNGNSVRFTATPIDGTIAAQQTVRITNLRGAALNFQLGLSMAVGSSGDIALASTSGCGTAPNYQVAAATPATTSFASATNLTPGVCTLTYSYAPKSTSAVVGDRSASVSIDIQASDGLPARSLSITLVGDAQAPMQIAPALLTFVPSTVQPLQATLTDRVGDSIRVCRAASDLASFSFPADYSLDAPYTLDPGDGCVTIAVAAPRPPLGSPRVVPLDVRFAAGGAGPRYAKLTAQRLNGGGTPVGALLEVQLHGNPGPVATVNASSLFDAPSDPGVEVDNDNVIDRSVTLFSGGTDPLTFDGSSFTIGGANAAEYSVVPGGCTALASLAAFVAEPAPSCVLTVRFNPSDVGRRAPATLTIRTNAGGTENVVTLNGLGIRGPRLAVSQSGAAMNSGDSLAFGAQTIGGLYAPRTLTLRNGGTVGDLEVVLPAAGSIPGFTVTSDGTCGNLAPAAQCSVDVRFNPTLVQSYAATLGLQSRPAGSVAAYNAFNLALTGQGTTSAVPTLEWTDASGTAIGALAFGNVDMGSPVTRTMRLRNAGPGGAVIGLVNAVGADAANFVLDTTACASGMPLYENTSCALTVRFAPASAGAKSATLQAVASVGSPSMSVVAPAFVVSGTGIGGSAPATLVPSATALTFGNTVVGAQSLPLELTLSNTGSRNIQVSGYEATAGYAVQPKSCPSAPFTLAVGSQCSLTLTFTPQSEGTVQGVLHVHSDAQAAPLDVALSAHADPKADVSGGGCTTVDGDSPGDPVLWLLVLLAAGVLWQRRRDATVHRRNEHEQ